MGTVAGRNISRQLCGAHHKKDTTGKAKLIQKKQRHRGKNVKSYRPSSNFVLALTAVMAT